MESLLQKYRQKLRVFRCHLCDLQFTDEAKLKRHSDRHNSPSFECEVCHRSFSTKSNQLRHSRLHSNGDLKCPTSGCEKTFTRPDYLKKHLEKCPTGKIRTRKCPKCSLAVRFDNFDRHMKVHDPSVRFKCSQCSSNYSRKDDLRTHVMRQHPV